MPVTDDYFSESKKPAARAPFPRVTSSMAREIKKWLDELHPEYAGQPGAPDWAFQANAARRLLVRDIIESIDAMLEAAAPKPTPQDESLAMVSRAGEDLADEEEDG